MDDSQALVDTGVGGKLTKALIRWIRGGGALATLTGKELRQMFLSPIAYAFLMVFVAFITYMFFRGFFLAGQATMSVFFAWFPLAFAVFVPGVVMRMWAEEWKQGTMEFLLTNPIETWQIVAAKFISGLTLVVLCVLLTLLVPYTVSLYGDLDPGPVWGGYLGAVLMGAACLAAGMFFSSFTQDQVVSFLISLTVLLMLVLMGMPFVQAELEPGSWFGTLAYHISPTSHFESIGRGVIDVRDLYYFGSAIVVFLYFNTLVIDLRRWR
ncbi:MAG: ABC transporter permease [Planctomycetota bacterium]|jgi:ABC-2 type transport system permease protein